MNDSFHVTCLKVLHSQTIDELKLSTQKAIASLGFEFFIYLISLRNNTEPSGYQFFFISTYPENWIEKYKQSKYHLIDPTALHVRNHYHPLPWTNCLFKEPSAQKMYEEAKQFGISAGVTFPIVTQRKEIAGFAYARHGDADENLPDAIQSMPYGCLLCTYVHEAATRMLQVEPTPSEHPFSGREIQCLNMAAQGLNDADIAQQMGLKIRTIRFHMANVRRKLKATTRLQMISRGIELNLLGL